jgi:hypothetical protein
MNRILAALARPRPVDALGRMWLCELRDALSDAGDTYPRKAIEEAYREGLITLESVDLLPCRVETTMVDCSATLIDGVVYHLAQVRS